MNERIKELIQQCEHTTQHSYAVGDGIFEVHHFDKEKFAELIIRECAQVAADFVPGYGLVPFSKRFNEHYGVEDKVSYSIPFVCIAVILVLTFMMVVSK